MALGAVVEQFDHHLVALLRIVHVVGGDDDVVLEELAVGVDDTSATHKLEAAYEGVGHERTGLVGVLFALALLFLLLLQSFGSDGLQAGSFALVRFAFFLPAQGTEIGFFHALRSGLITCYLGIDMKSASIFSEKIFTAMAIRMMLKNLRMM